MADTLFERLSIRVDSWRESGYACPEYPEIAEILDYSYDKESKSFRFLRAPQFRALETYWYLRLIEKSPKIPELYERLYPKQSERRRIYGLESETLRDLIDDEGLTPVLARVFSDGEETDEQKAFVKEHKLESLRETLALDYPSYILALAMGAGKTILMAAIMATEFAMAQTHPSGPFVKNGLLFAPGKTIIESLREVLDVRYEKILPPRFYKPFAASVKITFTRDGEKDIPVIDGSLYNLVVTNTEKIRIQKPTRKRAGAGALQLRLLAKQEEQEAEANRRLRKLATLPSLAIFSDEAHHTFGKAMGEGLKRVRETINYLHENTNLICVVNTTGTPFLEKQPLKDVVVWYGLAQGIRDGILKEVKDNVVGYSFGPEQTKEMLRDAVTTFFADYANTRLPDGALAKIAIYFPQNDDLTELRPHIELALAEAGQDASVILRNTSESSKEEVDAFHALNHPASPHRVILLVNKGTEGWNCPSLFGCVLARKLSSSNNFVLQAATRCLRQVPGNVQPARIYLSKENRAALDTQLQETYGESLADLSKKSATLSVSQTITVLKREIPPLSVTRTRRIVVPKTLAPETVLTLTAPKTANGKTGIERAVYTPALRAATKKVLQQVGDTLTLDAPEPSIDLYAAASDLAAVYRLPVRTVLSLLRAAYPGASELPEAHLFELAEQLEKQTRAYEVKDEQYEIALALLKPEGFTPDENGNLVAQVSVPKNRLDLLMSREDAPETVEGIGFHFEPYHFDSSPEKDFYDRMLVSIGENPSEVEDIYFTGGFTDRSKTDFFVEYRAVDGTWKDYYPDFLIRRKDGRCLIVEIKARRYENDATDGRVGVKANAARLWQASSKDNLRYEIYFSDDEEMTPTEIKTARTFVQETPT